MARHYCPQCGQVIDRRTRITLQHLGRKPQELPTTRRQTASRGTTFETTAQAVAVNSKPFGGFQKPLIELGRPLDPSPLSPGESRTSKTYRARSLDDIWPPMIWAGVSGGFVGIAGGLACVAFEWQWFAGVGIWFGATAIAWFVSSRDLLDDDKLIANVQEMIRAPEPVAPIFSPPAAEVVITSRDGKVQKRAKLLPPRTNLAGLWQYADALVRETAAPSYEGGEHVLGAKAFGYTPGEFDGQRGDEWRPVAIKGGILEEDPHKSKGYRLTVDGRRALAVVAERRLGEWG